MLCKGKHINALYSIHRVAVFGQHTEVASERLGVAGNVYYALGCEGNESREKFPRAAGSGRVCNDNVGVLARACQLHHELPCIRTHKTRVFDAVSACVFLGIAHGVRVQLNSNDLTRTFCRAQPDSSRAAVSVNDTLRARKRGELYCLFVEELRLSMVYLIEGTGTNAKLKSAQPVRDVALSVESV